MRYHGSEKYKAQARAAAEAIQERPGDYPEILREWAKRFLAEHGATAAAQEVGDDVQASLDFGQ